MKVEIELKDLLRGVDEDDIQLACLDLGKDMICIIDEKDAKASIQINSESIDDCDIEVDDEGVYITVDGHFIPQFIIDMIKENRFAEVKHEIERLGI